MGRTAGLANNAFLRSAVDLADFRLTCEVLLVDDRGNSGIQFRSQARAVTDVSGLQADIGPGWWGKLYDEHGRGLLVDTGAADVVRRGEWNTYEITAVGSRIRLRLNGELCVDLDDGEARPHGIVAFQLHSGGADRAARAPPAPRAGPDPRLRRLSSRHRTRPCRAWCYGSRR